MKPDAPAIPIIDTAGRGFADNKAGMLYVVANHEEEAVVPRRDGASSEKWCPRWCGGGHARMIPVALPS